MAQKALPVSMQHETTMMCWSWSGGGVVERGTWSDGGVVERGTWSGGGVVERGTWSGGGVTERGRRMSSGGPVDSW